MKMNILIIGGLTWMGIGLFFLLIGLAGYGIDYWLVKRLNEIELRSLHGFAKPGVEVKDDGTLEVRGAFFKLGEGGWVQFGHKPTNRVWGFGDVPKESKPLNPERT